MAWPMFVAGMALQIYGNYTANQAQAAAEEKNAQFYDYEAQFAEFAGKRERKIFLDESTYQRGLQIGSIGASGVDLTSSSALAFVANENANALDELNAIDVKTAMDVKLARERAQMSRDKASGLRDPMNNMLQMGGTVLSGSAQYLKSSESGKSGSASRKSYFGGKGSTGGSYKSRTGDT